jgi:hypothetical protein
MSRTGRRFCKTKDLEELDKMEELVLVICSPAPLPT